MFSLIIPTYNEGKNIKNVIGDVLKVFKKHKIKGEIIVVDDSNDNTVDILRELEKEINFLKVIHRENERGIGSAIRVGLKKAKGKYVMIMMGDGSDDSTSIPRFIERLNEGYDVVIGSRFISGGGLTGYSTIKLIANRLANNFIKFLFGLKTNDITYITKAYKATTIMNIETESNWFDIGTELTLKAIKSGAKYCQIPVAMYPRASGKPVFGSNIKNLLFFGSRYIKTVFRIYFSSA